MNSDGKDCHTPTGPDDNGSDGADLDNLPAFGCSKGSNGYGWECNNTILSLNKSDGTLVTCKELMGYLDQNMPGKYNCKCTAVNCPEQKPVEPPVESNEDSTPTEPEDSVEDSTPVDSQESVEESDEPEDSVEDSTPNDSPVEPEDSVEDSTPDDSPVGPDDSIVEPNPDDFPFGPEDPYGPDDSIVEPNPDDSEEEGKTCHPQNNDTCLDTWDCDWKKYDKEDFNLMDRNHDGKVTVKEFDNQWCSQSEEKKQYVK